MTLGFESLCILAQLVPPHIQYSVRQIGNLLTASFRPYLAVAALAVRLEIPVIKALRGFAPPSHFLAHFRLRVPNTPVMALRAMPGAHKKMSYSM